MFRTKLRPVWTSLQIDPKLKKTMCKKNAFLIKGMILTCLSVLENLLRNGSIMIENYVNRQRPKLYVQNGKK